MSKKSLLWEGLSFLFPLLLYAYTACPKPYIDDCAEFIFGPVTLSVIHPPGYPIYCILGKIFSYLPIGEIAWRLNFFSGFCTALASLFLYLIIYTITKKEICGLLGAWLFAFADVPWSQAVSAEVYGLNVFFTTLTIYLLIIWRKTKNIKWLYLFSFLYGLSLTNHHLMALLGPAYILYIFWEEPSLIKNIKWYIIMLSLFVLGLTPYLYLPIRAGANPFLNWGDPSNFQRFFFHISRKIYGDIDYKNFYNLSTKLKFFAFFIKELTRQFYLPLFFAGLFGFYKFFKKNLKLNLLSLYVFSSSSFIILYLLQFSYEAIKIYVVTPYFIPSYAIFAVWISVGLNEISHLKLFKEKWMAAFLIFPLILLFGNFHKNNLRNNYVAYDFTKGILDTMDEGAIFFITGDTIIFNTLYLRGVEGYRKDIKLYDYFGIVSGEYLGRDLVFLTEEERGERRRIITNKIVEENYGKKPIYSYADFGLGDDSKYELAEYGLIFKVVKKGEGFQNSIKYCRKIKFRNLGDPKFCPDEKTAMLLTDYYLRLSRFYIKQNKIARAEKILDKMLELNLGEPAAELVEGGLYYLEAGNYKKAYLFFIKAQKADPASIILYFYLAEAQKGLGLYEEARKNYTYFLEHCEGEPNYTEQAQKNLEEIITK